jgi:hypothetical protein
MGAFVQSRSVDAGNVSSAALTFNSSTVSGNLATVAIQVGEQDDVVTSVTDNKGNTYTRRSFQPSTGAEAAVYIYDAKNIVGGASHQITVTLSTAKNLRFAIHEYSGADTTSPFDQVADDFGNSTTLSSGNLTTTQAMELLFCAGITRDGRTFTPDGTFTQREVIPAAANTRLVTQDRMVTAIGTYAGTFTLNSSNPWACALVSYKDSGVGHILFGQSASRGVGQGTFRGAH